MPPDADLRNAQPSLQPRRAHPLVLWSARLAYLAALSGLGLALRHTFGDLGLWFAVGFPVGFLACALVIGGPLHVANQALKAGPGDSGGVLARWTYSPEEWRPFVEPAVRASALRRAAIDAPRSWGAFALPFAAIAGVPYFEHLVLFGLSLVVGSFGLIMLGIVLFARRPEPDALFVPPVVRLGRGWVENGNERTAVGGSRLLAGHVRFDSAEVIDERILRIRVIKTRRGKSSEFEQAREIDLLIPQGRLEEARALATTVLSRD